MQGIRRELQAGWNDARWGFYFSIALLPTIAVAFGLAYLLEGGATTPPSALTWVLCAVGTLVSLYWAGLMDGLDGRLGRHVWLLTLLLIGYWLILALLHSQETEKQARVRIGRRHLAVFVTIKRIPPEPYHGLRLPPADIRWEDLVPG